MIDINVEDIEPINEVNVKFLTQWLDKVTQLENKKLGELTFIFTSDDYLLEVNKQYLDHDYYTDIITFDYCEDDYVIGDLFISIDRVKDNAQTNNTTFQNELNRVIVHGVLHLCGYKDKSEIDEQLMRQKENQMLALI